MKKTLVCCGLAFALSGVAGCSWNANKAKPFMDHAPLTTKILAPPASPSMTFNSDVKKLENDLKQIDSNLNGLEASRAAIYLKAAISKLTRLEKGFAISSPKITADLNAVVSVLESGSARDACMSIQKAIVELEALRQQAEGKASTEIEGLLDRMKKLQEMPKFLRKMVSGKIKRLAGNIDAAMSSLKMLQNEKGLAMDAPDDRALKMIEPNLEEMRKSALSIRSQLDEVRGMEIAKAERSVAESLKELEKSGSMPEDFAKRANATTNLKAALKQLDRLRKHDK